MVNYAFEPILSRRELLRAAGVSMAASFGTAPPLRAGSSGKANPVATARQVIFIMLDGGFSHVDGWDAKEGAWTPKDFGIQTFGNGVAMPSSLFQQLPGHLGDVAVLRNLNAWDAVHGRAQYYLQTGHPLNLALSKEVPSIGSVIGWELQSRRKESDSLPPFVALNGISSQAGLITQGFLSAEYAPLNLQVEAAGPPKITPESSGDNNDFDRRWKLLEKLDGALRKSQDLG